MLSLSACSFKKSFAVREAKKAGNILDEDMLRVFNNGLGLVIVVSEEDCDEVLLSLKAMGEEAYHIGTVEAKGENDPAIEYIE